MNKFLTKEDIEIILNESKNPMYKNPEVFGFYDSNNPLTIAKITKRGIIFFYGNNDTGVNHILKRHSYGSNSPNWFNQKDQDRIDNPSIFSLRTRNLIDFIQIADDLYNAKNIDTSNNELFDKYLGVSSVIDNTPEEYVLILYKGTKIVHTLYPKKKKHNIRNQILNFKRSNLKVKEYLFKEVLVATYKYTDKDEVVRYILNIVLYQKTKLIKTWIQVNSLHGMPLYSEQIAENYVDKIIEPEQFFMATESLDISKVERSIKRFDKAINGSS